MNRKRKAPVEKPAPDVGADMMRFVYKLRSGPADDVKALASDALRMMYFVSSELHVAQVALNARFVAGDRPGEWRYLEESVGPVGRDGRIRAKHSSGAWLDVVEALPRFRRSIEAVTGILPCVSKMMDSHNQAIPDRWTFRVRVEMAELESMYSNEQAAREFLKSYGRPEDEAGSLLRFAPMPSQMLQRFGELVEGLRIRSAEIQFARDFFGNWKLPEPPGAKGPLSPRENAVFDLIRSLRQGEAMTGEKIVSALAKATPAFHISTSALTKDIIPRLRLLGVRNRRGVGYYIDAPNK